jgi:sugar lactone lactonase YvrE
MRTSRRRRTAAGISLAAAALLTVPSVAAAAGRGAAKPLDIRQGSPVGFAAETNGINGIYVNPVDGRVYAASVGGNEITVHDPVNGKVIDRLGPADNVVAPDDVFITDDGTIYSTELLTGNVRMLAPDGTTATLQVGPGVNPITMSDDGRLFVGRIFLGEGLYELAPDLSSFARVDDPADPLVINAFDFGPDGDLYAPAFFTGEVKRIDVGEPFVADVDVSVVADGFGIISALKFNSIGEPHLVQLGEGRVLRLDLEGGAAPQVLIDIEGTIDNIAFAADDTLFAAAGVDNQLLRRDVRGKVKVLGKQAFGAPSGIAVSQDGTVWVTELFGLRGFDTNRRTASTSFYDTFPAPGTVFAGASTVAADGDDLIISSGFANSVQVIDPATGAISLDVRTVAAPVNALRHGGVIVAAQAGFGNVVEVETGDSVLDASMLGGAPLFLPLGLASDGDTLYVADYFTGIVWAVSDAGVAPLTSGLQQPEGLAVDGDRLLVVEVGTKQVTAVDLATGAQSPAIVGLNLSDVAPDGFFPFGNMSGVAVGPDGDIYVSDDGVNQVWRFNVGNGRR